MQKQKVLYKGLSSIEEDIKKFLLGRQTDRKEIAAFERALILMEYPETSKFLRAYSVVGWATESHDQVSTIFLREEKPWEEKEARKILSGGNAIEACIDLDEYGSVLLEEPGNQRTYRVPVEGYLMDRHGAFPKLKSEYSEALKREFETMQQKYAKFSSKD